MRKKRTNPEYVLQCQVAQYLDLHPKHPLYSADCGGMRTSIGTATKMKRMGHKKGIQDVFVFEPRNNCHGLAIEIKTKEGEPYPDTKRGVPSVEQYTWMKDLNERGYKAVICYGFNECKKAIDEYLG
jgi:hypothetical protein